MIRSTKIVATLGPASSSPEILEQMFRAGVDVVRFNFSHGTAEDHLQRAEMVRELCRKTGRTVGIMGDLQGPKIRVGKFKDGKVTLKAGDAFILDADCEIGDQHRAGLDYKELPHDVKAGDVLLLDDGRIEFEVERVVGNEVHCRVHHGGVLSNNKGINRRGGGLTAPALTTKDMDDIRTAAKINVDFLAVSFPKSSADMYMARQLLRAAGGDAFLIAKIERAEAVVPGALEDIMSACDGIMVARGDLAVEVANAVLDGTDAVMLSAETASGLYPVETVLSMARICSVAESSAPVTLDREFLDRVFTRVDQSIAMAALFTAYHLKVKAIAALTESGSTALWMSRLNCGVPIYALTTRTSTRYRCALFRDTYPQMVNYAGTDREELLEEAENVLLEAGLVANGDLIVLTIGEPIGKSGGTNTMKIVKVGEHRRS